MGSGRQLDDDTAGGSNNVDILAMLTAASSEKGPGGSKRPPPGFETKVVATSTENGDTQSPRKDRKPRSGPRSTPGDGTPGRGRKANDGESSQRRGSANKSERGPRTPNNNKSDSQMTTKELLEQSRSLPKRQLWVVRVPAPPADDDTELQIATKEQRVLKLTATIDDAMEKLSNAKAIRDEAREAIAPVREQLREVNDELREKQVDMKPLLAVVSASNAKANEVKQMGRELKGVSTEQALEDRLDDLEHKMSHEPLTVLEQKAVLREIQKLKEKRCDIQNLQGKRDEIEASLFDRETAASRLKLMRSLCDFIKVRQTEVKKLFDHYKKVADAADEQAKVANERRAAAADERRTLTAELRTLRKLGARDRGEFYRSRRVVSKARELVKKGDVAEAESLCMEQMEHVHARLAMDGEYRKEYVEGLVRTKLERAAQKDKKTEELKKTEAEEDAKKQSAKKAKDLEAEQAAKEAAVAAKEASKAAAKAAKEAQKQAELELKRQEEDLKAQALEQKAIAKQNKIATAPVLEPGVLQLARMAQAEEERVQLAGEGNSFVELTETTSSEDPAAVAKRKKRAEKKARKKESKREKHEGEFASGSGDAQVSPSTPLVSEEEPIVSEEEVAYLSEPEPEPMFVAKPAPSIEVEERHESYATSNVTRTSTQLKSKPVGVLRLTDDQRGWVAIALLLVAMAIFSMASGYRLEVVRV